jgi:hypothetical protein
MKEDPFIHLHKCDSDNKLELDLHDQFHLTTLINYSIEVLEHNMANELRNDTKVFKDLTLVTPLEGNGKFEYEIVNSLTDQRFELFSKYCFKSFLALSEDKLLVDSIRYITPNFLCHFNIIGIKDKEALGYIVKFQAL